MVIVMEVMLEVAEPMGALDLVMMKLVVIFYIKIAGMGNNQ